MLTTEKLFRGDTEFALMEKVRKAEVPPPSNFNRRVPEALDAIVLKALARDVADRYQSAGSSADDLDAFIAQYRFKPKEMQEFMRGLFRADYSKEADEIEACRAATHRRRAARRSRSSRALIRARRRRSRSDAGADADAAAGRRRRLPPPVRPRCDGDRQPTTSQTRSTAGARSDAAGCGRACARSSPSSRLPQVAA